MADFWNNLPTTEEMRGEANVELRLVIPLLHALGYEPADIDSKYPVIFQEGRLGRKPEADLVCFYGPLHNKDTSLVVVEAKTLGEALPDGKSQGDSYAANLRAPLLLLTNGEELEVWQLQATRESTRVLAIPVSALTAERGMVESVLGKEAVLNYCRSFHVKTILEASTDYGPYETAELARLALYTRSIGRTLHDAQEREIARIVDKNALLTRYSSGSIVVAPSGYGKSTLSRHLLCQAIEKRWRGDNERLPFEVPLPDVEQTSITILEFMRQRLAAHCPGVTSASFTRLLRDVGATAFCDGFDRTSTLFQKRVSAEFTNLLRDYPRLQLFVFSRVSITPAISLPLLSLEPLSDDQARELEQEILSDGRSGSYSIIGMMPPTLRSLCFNPLVLSQALQYWKREQDFPRKIERLFQSWLNNLIATETSDYISTVQRELGMTLLSQATFASPLTPVQALNVLKEHGIPDTILRDLVACDAIQATGSTIEVQHEALADYLRAKAFASTDEEELLSLLPSMAMPANSFFPVMLMAQLRTHRLQSALWKRLSTLSLDLYFDALRYRFDVSDELERLDSSKLSGEYLEALVEGIETPLEGFFPQIAKAVLENLTSGESGSLAVTGLVHAYPGALSYKLHARSPQGPRATVGRPSFPGVIRSVNLDTSRYRIDSAHLLGASLLRESVFDAVKHLQLKGGPVWAAERLIGRVRYLAERYDLPIGPTATFDEIEGVLRPFAGKWVDESGFSGDQRFSIQSLVDDIATLRAEGQAALDLWWLRLGWKENVGQQDEDVIRLVLAEDYRRQQLAFAEVVQASFPNVLDREGFYTALPVRWQLDVSKQSRRHGLVSFRFKWLPVESWNQAGADVTFTDEQLPFGDVKETREALRRLNRPSSLIPRFSGFTQLSSYNGRQWDGSFDGATTVTHEVRALLQDELKRVFDKLPSSDGAF